MKQADGLLHQKHYSLTFVINCTDLILMRVNGDRFAKICLLGRCMRTFKNLLVHIYHAMVPRGIRIYFNIQHHSDICTEYSDQEPKLTIEYISSGKEAEVVLQ